MSSQVCWHVDAWKDDLYWQKNDKKILQKINELIKTPLLTALCVLPEEKILGFPKKSNENFTLLPLP